MDIKRQGEILFAHGRTFNMPTGASFSPRAVPSRFAGFCTFPEREIQGIVLFLAGSDARSGEHFVQIAPGKLAVIFKGTHPIVNIAGRRGVGHILADERFAQGDHLRDILRGFGFHCGRFNPE